MTNRAQSSGTIPALSRSRSVHLDIAGVVFRVVGVSEESLDWLKERYRPFLSNKPASVTLKVELQQRRPRGRPPRPSVEWRNGNFTITLAACRAEGSLATKRVRLFVPPAPSALSPSLFRILCSLLLLREGGFLLHASGIVQNRRAWVFCGPSESGKTTIALLAGKRRVLNDETVAILKRPRSYVACATPFFGEGGPAMAMMNTQAPIKGMFFLHQAEQFSHRQLTAREAIEQAFSQVFLPKRDSTVVSGILGNLADFAGQVPCYNLFFPPRADLWEYLDRIA